MSEGEAANGCTEGLILELKIDLSELRESHLFRTADKTGVSGPKSTHTRCVAID